MKAFLRPIRALATRDWRIAKTYPVQLAGRYPLALISIGTFFFISKLIESTTVRLGDFNATYFDFVIVGLLISGFSLSATRAFIGPISSEQSTGTLELLLGSPARSGSLLLGLSVTPFSLGLGDIAVYVLLGLIVLGSGFSSSGLLTLIPVLILVWIVFAAFGVFSAGMTVITKRGDPIGILVTNISNLLAGSLFPVAILPRPLEVLSFLIPTRYALDASRAALLGSAPITAVLPELAVLFIAALILVPLSMVFFRWSVNTARTTGTLTTG